MQAWQGFFRKPGARESQMRSYFSGALQGLKPPKSGWDETFVRGAADALALNTLGAHLADVEPGTRMLAADKVGWAAQQ